MTLQPVYAVTPKVQCRTSIGGLQPKEEGLSRAMAVKTFIGIAAL